MKHSLAEIYDTSTTNKRLEFEVFDRFYYLKKEGGLHIFEYIVEEGGDTESTFDEVKKYVKVYQNETHSLASMQQAKVILKYLQPDDSIQDLTRRPKECFVTLEKKRETSDNDLLSDIQSYWTGYRGKVYRMAANSGFSFHNYDRDIGLLRMRGEVGEGLLRRYSGLDELVRDISKEMLPFVEPHFDIKIIEFDITIRSQGNTYRYAGFDLDSLERVYE